MRNVSLIPKFFGCDVCISIKVLIRFLLGILPYGVCRLRCASNSPCKLKQSIRYSGSSANGKSYGY